MAHGGRYEHEDERDAAEAREAQRVADELSIPNEDAELERYRERVAPRRGQVNRPGELAALANVDGYWYLATPYTKFPGGLDAAYRLANEAAARFLRGAVRVFCPIAHSHSLCAVYGTKGGVEDALEPEFWKWADAPLLAAAHGVIVVMADGWSDSRGIAHEIDYARKHGKPVLYYTWPRLVLWEAEV